MMEVLAQSYREQARWSDASETWRELVASSPEDPQVCRWQSAAVEVALASGDRAETASELRRLAATVAHILRLPRPSEEAKAGCRQAHQEAAKKVALFWHKKGQRERDQEALAAADPVYRAYLERFDRSAEHSEMAFLHAELLWVLERFDEAAGRYRQVLEADPKGPRREEAAYGYVLAVMNAVGAGEDALRPAAPAAKPSPLTPAAKSLLEAFETYLTYVPASDQASRMRFRRARLLYDFGHLARAIPAFAEIVEKDAGHEIAIYAANLHLDSLQVLKRRAELCAHARGYVKGPLAARDAEFARQLERLVAGCASSEKSASPKKP
jgi:tetratricopeptide (TPR) repeat protein